MSACLGNIEHEEPGEGEVVRCVEFDLFKVLQTWNIQQLACWNADKVKVELKDQVPLSVMR